MKTEEDIDSFKKDILEVYKKHNLFIVASDEEMWEIEDLNVDINSSYFVCLFKNSQYNGRSYI